MKKTLSEKRFARVLTAKYRQEVKELYFSTVNNLWIAVMKDGKRFEDRTQKDALNSVKFYVDMKEKEKNMSENNKFAFDDEMEDAPVASSVIEPLTITCVKCGNEFVMSPTEIKFYREHGYEMPKRCPDCRVDKADVTEVVCKDCGATFEVSAREKDYFVSRGLSIPKRCKSCREFRKKNQK